VLKETGLAPDRLEIEVPESLFLSETSEAMEVLHRVKALGVRVSVLVLEVASGAGGGPVSLDLR
jgi:predicted signal transduction protein with EAL and GGDEF domain